LFEKVWAIVFAMSGKSETSTLFTFKCRIGLEEGFPAILRTIVQTFFIEVRLLILDTKDCQDLHMVDFIVHLVLARLSMKQCLIDTYHKTSSVKQLVNGESDYVQA